MSDQKEPETKKRGRPAQGDRAMTDAERSAKRRASAKKIAQQADFEKERTLRAHEHLKEVAEILGEYWRKNNANRDPKISEAIAMVDKLSRRVADARKLMSPVWHLFVTTQTGPTAKDHDTPVEPRRLICGSTDFENATDAMGFYYSGSPESKCPECDRRKREFYKGW